MPSGEVAPGWVLPTCGLGHHHVAARPLAGGRQVAAVPINGSTSSRMARTLRRRLSPEGYSGVNTLYTPTRAARPPKILHPQPARRKPADVGMHQLLINPIQFRSPSLANPNQVELITALR